MNERFGLGSLGLLDPMEVLRKTWASFNIPSGLTPTLDLDELDKRITDLKTVEQWLSMNLSMLQTTIQGLEIQRGTIAAVKAFGQAMQQAPTAGRTQPTPETTPAPPSAPDTSGEQADATATAEAAEASSTKPAGLAEEIVAGLSRAASSVNPSAWWHMINNQFQQVAQAAAAMAEPAAGAAPNDSGPGAAAAPPASESKRPTRRPAKSGPGSQRARPTGTRRSRTGGTP